MAPRKLPMPMTAAGRASGRALAARLQALRGVARWHGARAAASSAPLARVMRRVDLVMHGGPVTHHHSIAVHVRQFVQLLMRPVAARRVAGSQALTVAQARNVPAVATALRRGGVAPMAEVGEAPHTGERPMPAVQIAMRRALPGRSESSTATRRAAWPTTPSFERLPLVLVRSAAPAIAPAQASSTQDAPSWPTAHAATRAVPPARPGESPPHALPPQELHRVTEHVMAQLDRRALSWRERHVG